MVRKIIDYLPHVLRDYREFKGGADGQQWLFDTLWDEVDKAFNDQFLDTATSIGISRWEKILKITPKGGDALETRRFRIKTRINEQLPFTITTLKQKLDALCGENGYTLTLDPGTYLLKVRIPLTTKSNVDDVSDTLHRMVPCNLVIDLSLLYNIHSIFSVFTHEDISVKTHEELRSEVLKNGSN